MATGEDSFWVVDMLASGKGEARLRKGREGQECFSVVIFVAAVAGESYGLQRGPG